MNQELHNAATMAAKHFRDAMKERDNYDIPDQEMKRITAAAAFLMKHSNANYVTATELMRITDNLLAPLGDAPWDLDGVDEYAIGFWEGTIMYCGWSV